MLKRSLLFTLLILIVLGLHTSGTASAQDNTYTVLPGDTLFSIAMRHNTSIDELITLNQLSNPNLIFVNQRLQLPATTPRPAESTTIFHTVQRGENLMRIAIRYNTSVTAIANLNNITDWNRIFVGQNLQITPSTTPIATPSPQPPTPSPSPTSEAAPTLQPTATTTAPPSPSPTPQTPPTLQPTAIPIASPSPQPPAPITTNILPNGSFENGWYNLDNIPELQVPNSWRLEWQEGPTGFGNEVWDVWVRPETRVLPADHLPTAEHPLFIYDGNYTVKIFKGNGAIHATLLTDIALQPGTYTFTVNVFPDLVEDYSNGQKVWASDPVSGDVRLSASGGSSTGWILPTFGQKNQISHTFTVNSAQTVTLSVDLRGRFAIQNNGWFIDDVQLRGGS